MDPVRILVLGAHPDDAEFMAGGAAVVWAKCGYQVRFISVTNGDVGHWKISGEPLARRRRGEVEASARVLGICPPVVMDNHDGELMPTLENRKQIVRLIRQWKADLVITHRQWDYHPDHRYTSILVQDAAYMVTVPFYCPDEPALKVNPVLMFASGVDYFQRPVPFQADVAIGIDEMVERKIQALDAMESQFLEGGCMMPFEPRTVEERQARLEQTHAWFTNWFARCADTYRSRLVELYGPHRGAAIRYAEAFELCEYGRRPDAAELSRLFPFDGLQFDGARALGGMVGGPGDSRPNGAD
jgi:N-acetylglucosamine malate deacetylase 1